MTKKDFFIALVKIFGLFSLTRALFSVLPQTLFGLGNAEFMLYTFGGIAVVTGLFLVFVFKAKAIVEFMKLDKGFEEDRIDLGHLSQSEIFKIAILLIGGLMIFNDIPLFFSYLNRYMRDRGSEGLWGKNEEFNWILCMVKIFVGVMMVTSYKSIVDLLGGKSSGEEQNK